MMAELHLMVLCLLIVSFVNTLSNFGFVYRNAAEEIEAMNYTDKARWTYSTSLINSVNVWD